MSHPTRLGVLSFLMMILSLTGSTAHSQTPSAPERANLDVQIHLLLANNEQGEKNVPPTLEPALKQLKATQSFSNYRLAATFANRIKSGGTLEVKGVLSSEVLTPIANNSVFYELTLVQVRLVGESENQSIDIPKLRFSLQLPVTAGTTRAEGNTPASPIISYQAAGLTTELNVREGTATVFGTMTTSRPGQLLVLVITVKRTT
jgi:hypothetical protein